MRDNNEIVGKLICNLCFSESDPCDISVHVIVENSVPSTSVDDSVPTTVDQIYDEFLVTCKVGLRKIRELPPDKLGDDMHTFTTSCKEFMSLIKDLERREKLVLREVRKQSLEFVFESHSKQGLKHFWLMYESGELLNTLKEVLITDDLLRKCNVKSIELRVQISEEEYQKCLANFGEYLLCIHLLVKES